MAFRCTIPGKPVGATRGRPGFRAGHPAIYHTTKHYMNTAFMTDWIINALREGWTPLETPLRLRAVAVTARPQYLMRRVDSLPGNRDRRLWHPRTPDHDNITKLVQDCAKVAGVFRDDAIIVSHTFEKLMMSYAEQEAGLMPCLDIRVYTDLPDPLGYDVADDIILDSSPF